MEWFVESTQKKQFLYFLFEEWQAMINFSGDDLYLTVYHPSPKMLQLLHALSASEGLFLWQPPQETT